MSFSNERSYQNFRERNHWELDFAGDTELRSSKMDRRFRGTGTYHESAPDAINLTTHITLRISGHLQR